MTEAWPTDPAEQERLATLKIKELAAQGKRVVMPVSFTDEDGSKRYLEPELWTVISDPNA